MPTINKTVVIYILATLLVSVSLISLAFFYKQLGEPGKNGNTGTAKSIPFDVDSVGVRDAGLSYYLTGTLMEVKPSGDSASWKVKTEDNKEYSFYVSKNADIFTQDPLRNPGSSPSASLKVPVK